MLWFGQTFTGGGGDWRTAANTINLNQWQFVAVTYDRSAVSNNPLFYINGIVSPTIQVAAPTGDADDESDYELTVGDRAIMDLSFDGLIDDVRIYNRVLNGKEIEWLYNMGI